MIRVLKFYLITAGTIGGLAGGTHNFLISDGNPFATALGVTYGMGWGIVYPVFVLGSSLGIIKGC